MGSKAIFGFVCLFILAVSYRTGRAQDSTPNKSDSLTHVGNVQDTIPKKNRLQLFREAFKKVIKQQQKIKQKKKVKKDPTLDLGVLIFNKTRSRMGQQFYHLFYSNWKPPKDAGNATITISEKPTPGLGSLVAIKIGYQKVFRARLQPRRQYIKALSKMAVKRCRKIIQQQAKVRQQLSGY
jgi:curli production assembly/transport component CsgE